MHWLRQLFRRDKPQIPETLWQDSLASLPFLQRLSESETARLKSLCETLLERKTFTGAGGFELTDETAVLIAAQAALPILNLTPDLYRIGASSLVNDILMQLRKEKTGAYQSKDYFTND